MASLPLTRIFREFFESERAGGLVLVGCTCISILLTNSGLGGGWLSLWHTRLDLSFGAVTLDHSVEYWINDGLMAIFFLLVGLEIERELYTGELADPKKALLPLVAALGGMVVPAGTHFLFNHGGPAQDGLGIPMATDIAFALGVLSLLGNKVPPSLKIFLAALAIIDDLGAILVIAIFYTKTIAWGWLAFALGIFLFLLALNKWGIKKLIFFILPGLLMWYAMERSGIHATLSGVLLAFAIPFRKNTLFNPSQKLQHFLHKPVAFLILPLFALANTGIVMSAGWSHSLLSRNSVGIIAGLVVGKPAGVLITCRIAISRLGCSLPEKARWAQVAGAGVLAGIGFTMSIFITSLAFNDPSMIQFSKIAILAASLLAGLLGYLLLNVTSRKRK